jgi:hypothetical protein
MFEDTTAANHTVWDRELVINKCRSSIDFQLWPPEIDSRLEPWLSNFTDTEMEYALCLLNGLSFFSEKMVKQVFLSAVHELSSHIRVDGRTLVQERAAWQHFFDNVLITTVTGETPNPADSGNLFARYSRNHLGFAEHQIVTNELALQRLLANGRQPVVFVDDFVGSGNQFIATWIRSHNIGRYGGISFARYAQHQPNAQFFYCPAFCTEFGLRKINAACPQVHVKMGNLVGDRYSAIHESSIMWPAKLRDSATDFLRSASERAGIPDSGGGEDDWRGFNQLALSIGFAHGVPDATLPLFTWDRNGWHYLLRAR